MDAINMLKEDHKKVRGLFRHFAMTGDRAFKQREQVAKKVFEDLDVHTKLEEEIFYPAVEATNQRGTELVREAREEHAVVAGLVSELKGTSPEVEEYTATFKILRENVEHHIKEEEGEILPYAKSTLGDAQLNELGSQMAARKHGLTQPSLLSGTLRQAKKVVTRALDALTGNEPKPRRRSSKSTPKSVTTKAGRRTRTTGNATQSRRGRKTAGSGTAGRAVAKSKRAIQKGARANNPRKAARSMTSAQKRVRRRGR